MDILLSAYEKQFDKFEENFESTYIKTESGKISLQKYLKLCDVKPRNIYSANNDFYDRYKKEAFIIYQSLLYIKEVYKISIKKIIQDIPEIETYYKWIIDMFENQNINTLVLPYKNKFKEVLRTKLDNYFKTVDRREYGEYYTPEDLIKLSYEHIEKNIENRVVDPACGSGFFLQVYIEELIKNDSLFNSNQIEIIKQNIHGYDIFPFPIITTKLLLGTTLNEHFGVNKNIFRFDNIQVHNTVSSLKCINNKTSDILQENFDLIIGNPPYFRIQPDDKNEICDCVSYGHNYIHNLFLHWGIQHLNSQGMLCLFLPQSILSGYYYQKMRKEILNECNLDLIISDKNHEKSFLVQQDIMILYLTKTDNKDDSFQIGTPNEDLTDVYIYKLPLNITDNSLKIIPVFKNVNQYIALDRLSSHSIVDKLYEVKLKTGNFVWNQNKESVLKDYQKGAIPLISGPNITETEISLGEHTKFSYCIPNSKKYLMHDSAILYRRMSPIGNEQRMIARVIDKDKIPVYAIENHVNSINCVNWSKKDLDELLEFITSKDFNILINAFCHTNQISTNEMKIIFETLINVKNSKKVLST
ncbi:N-6 DNA methylase [Mammaliicoccus lentus]|uniref:site-specific DNA-methyltransferase (adenine-specific) n=1 Tax=Mammaliicoccus lentus TaxID=42858 RepID=A0ABS6GXJ5_MAMLE|nr:N-6 DNA methylase [Mammaliicoccus lentus]MBU6113708.1 N-6 DNA methylase [Mammaliicoccus lentus]